MTQRLDTLPFDALLQIFKNCTLRELSRLCRTCKYFYTIISSNEVWTERSKKFLFTNQVSERFRERCNPLLSSRDQCIVSYCWRRKTKYKTNVHILKYGHACGFPMHMRMTKDVLWYSYKNKFLGFKRTGHCITTSDVISYKSIRSNHRSRPKRISEIRDFVPCNDVIISCHYNGSIKKWAIKQVEKDGKKIDCLRVTKTYSQDKYTSAIDATSHVIISSHFDDSEKERCIIKIRRNIQDMSEESVHSECMIQRPDVDNVYALAIDPTGTKFAVGLDDEICIFDINNALSQQDKSYRRLEYIVWENSYTFLTFSDSHIYKWDLRTDKCVRTWTHRTNDYVDTSYTLTCVSSDYQYTIMTGTSHGAVLVWDQRQLEFVSMYDLYEEAKPRIYRIYHSQLPYKIESINSVQFDSSHLYGVTQRCLYEYSSTFVKQNVYQNDVMKMTTKS